jgi:adenosylcobinamide-GDP ribazoletransferase
VPSIPCDTGDLGRSSPWFPLVGAVIGAILAGAAVLFGALFPPLATNALVVVLWAFLTRGIHLDGLADTFDGIGGGYDPASRLAIMKDSRLGTFGGIAVASALLLKTAAAAGLTGQDLLRALFAAPILGRWGILFAMGLFPSARPGGMGDTFRKGCTTKSLATGSILTVALALAAFGWRGILPLLAVPFTALLLSVWLTRLLGGLTGDSYGAVCETTELLTLLCFSVY